MAGLPVSLIIAIRLVVTTWIVGAVALCFDLALNPFGWRFPWDSVAVVEWNLFKNSRRRVNEDRNNPIGWSSC